MESPRALTWTSTSLEKHLASVQGTDVTRSYLATHMKMIDRDWKAFGMKTWSVATFKTEDSLDGKQPRYRVQTTILWDKVEDLKAALAEGSKETMKDIANYCDVSPEIWVSKIAGKGGFS